MRASRRRERAGEEAAARVWLSVVAGVAASVLTAPPAHLSEASQRSWVSLRASPSRRVDHEQPSLTAPEATHTGSDLL
ncbi:hypothetical protein BJY59DRAFT_702001 [Rhodotorula toruloides]